MRRRIAAALGVLAVVFVGLLWLRGRVPITQAASPPAASRRSVQSVAAPAARSALRLEDREPPGTLHLQGQVVDCEGLPVADAEVTITTTPQQSIRTRVDGMFLFDGLLPRAYAVRARRGALVADPVEVRLQVTSDRLTLVLRSVPAIEVMVVDATDRHPIAGAQLAVEGQEKIAAQTDARGRAHLEGIGAGRYVVSASAEGYATARQPVFHAARASAVTPVLLALQRGAAVHGRAVSADGSPVPGARIHAVRTTTVAKESSPGDEVVADANGDWSVEALPAATFRFAAVHPRFAPALSEPLTLDGRTPSRGVIITLQRGARLTGRVVDKLGGPASFARVEVRSAGPGVLVELRRSTFADQNGAFDLRGLPCSRLQVEARGDDAASLPQEVDLASCTGDLSLAMEADGSISGVVVTPGGDPAPGARVVAVPDSRADLGELAASKSGRYAADVADEGGAFHLRRLGLGRYRLRASLVHSEQMASFWLIPGIAAEPGDAGVRIVLEASGHLRGSVELAGGVVPEVFTATLTLSPAVTFAGTHGAFVLDDVPPGNHTLTFGAPGAEPWTKDVTVAPGEDKDLGRVVLPRGRSLTGRVIDSDGAPIAGATVLGGPQILGDGRQAGSAPLQGRSDALGQFTLSGAGEDPITMLAEHPTAGRSLPVVVDPSSAPIELQLRSLATLEGTITRQGILAGGVAVAAAPRGSSTGRFLVTTQADGRYHFDRLSAGEYVVTAALRVSATVQILQSVTTLVGSGGGLVDIDVELGTCPVQIQVLEADGRRVENAQIHLSTGQITARSLGELEAARARIGSGQTRILLILQGQPVVIPDLTPGPYTVCVVPVRGDLADPAVAQRIRDHAGEMPVSCTPVAVEQLGAPQQVVVRLAGS